MSACGGETSQSSNKKSSVEKTKSKLGSNKKKTGDNTRATSDPVFISHEGISKAVSKQIWKEIIFGDYNVDDIKLFDLGKQTSKEGEKYPYQIMSFGFQIPNDKEIFRISLKAEIKDQMLHYQLNEKPYFSCKEELYSPDDFSYEMKIAISKLLADDYLKRKIVELNR